MKCSDVYWLFFNPGEVVEIRSYGLNGTSSAWRGRAFGEGVVLGYFDDAEAFGQAAESLDRSGALGVYFTLNPVIPDLLSRCANRLQASGPKTSATTDRDVLCIRWLPIDLDPVRPKGISSTNEELMASGKVAERIRDALVLRGWCQPIMAVSGNGCHVAFRLPDLPNTADNAALVHRAIMAVKAEFETPEVEIDTKVGNPARIWRLYGTTARKGDSTERRPHRQSRLFRADE